MTRIQEADILLIDDNPDLLTLVSQALSNAGFANLRTAQTCAAARRAFAARAPQLMILDINLPDGDGFTLFRELNAGGEVPVLFLSARDADADRLFGLGLGADDYLTKPFLTQELLLRVQLILRRAYRAELQGAASGALRLGGRRVDLRDATVTLPGGEHPAPDRHRAHAAAKARGQPRPTSSASTRSARLSGNVIYYGCENTLGVHIRHLREKIEPEPGRPQYLPDSPRPWLQASGGGGAMSALGRLIRRYVLAGVGIALGIVLLNVAIFIGIVGVVGYRQGAFNRPLFSERDCGRLHPG